MLSSCKGLEPRSLRSSTTRSIGSSQSRNVTFALLAFNRGLPWDSRHEDTTSRIGRVCHNVSIQGIAGQDLTRKQLYRGAFWGNHHVRRYFRRCGPVQEWRFSSSWGRPPKSISRSRDKTETNDEVGEDWYTRWKKHNSKQYEDFMKKAEQDPYTVVFGKNYMELWRGKFNPRVTKTLPPDAPEDSHLPKNNGTAENWPLRLRQSIKKTSDNIEPLGRQPKSETVPIQGYSPEYVIDPITNRKVFKASPSLSALGQDKPRAGDGDKPIDPGHWDLVSRLSFDRRSIVVEHPQVLSSSEPQSKDASSQRPHNSDGWLAQEGFGGTQKPKSDHQASQTHDPKADTTVTKIESALDRHLSRKCINEKRKSDSPQTKYKSEENRTEDVDLLRSSDVRASSGLRGHAPKESDVDKQARRKNLEERYEKASPDRPDQLAGEAASIKLVQQREDRPVRRDKTPEPRFGSWVKEASQDVNLKNKEALKGASSVLDNEMPDARDYDPFTVNQALDSAPLFKKENVAGNASGVALRAQHEIKDKASKLKAQIGPFKAKLDAMKADYDFLRLQWIQETRRLKERAAKEEQMKTQRITKMARQIHEEEILTQKRAMEAMEMRSSDRTSNTAKTTLAKGIGNDDVEKLAPRRLQSFIQGEGDMASNVHEFAGRDRWYKRKAPHAIDAKDAEMDAKLQKLATDRALIREIRDIYEDTYGTIDTTHRQTRPSRGCSDQPKTSLSEKIAPHVPSAATINDPPKSLERSQTSYALATVHKLFGELRKVQAFIQDYQNLPKQSLDLKFDHDTDMSKTLRISLQEPKLGPGNVIRHASVEVTAPSNTGKHPVNCPPSTVAAESDLKIQKSTKLNTYCILAYNSATESVQSVDSTTLAPFSKEESLLPLAALTRLSNPGKFLPYVITLVEKGYKPVSGTSNILVFENENIPQDLAGGKTTDVKKELDPNDNSLNHLPVISDVSDISVSPKEHHLAELQGIETEQQKVKEAQKQVEDKIEKDDQEVERSSEASMDGIIHEKQPVQEGQKQQSASSTSPSHASGEPVHRQERVFSGSRHGRWIDNNAKSKRSKRAAERRHKTKYMILGGGLTATCCYLVGVASEVMRGW